MVGSGIGNDDGGVAGYYDGYVGDDGDYDDAFN